MVAVGGGSELHGVLADVRVDFGGRRSDIVIRLGVREGEVLAGFPIAIEHELADVLAIGAVVAIAEKRKTEPLLGQLAAELSAAAARPVPGPYSPDLRRSCAST